MIDSVFLLSVVTILSGIIGLLIRYAFKSKCVNINCCCGLCAITRDIQREIDVEITTRPTNLSPTADNSSPRLSKSTVGFSEV